MPAVAPSFPAAQSSHLDLQIRELYRRVGTIERVLRTSAPSPAPASHTVKTVEGRVVYCVRGTLHYDMGWGTFGDLRRGGALYLLKLFPPSVVVSVSAYLSRAFESDEGEEESFEGFALSDVEPNEETVSLRLIRYWGDEFNPDVNSMYPWVSSPIAIDLKVQHPSSISYWYNVRRYQTGGRMGRGRPNIVNLPYLPFTCGWVFGGVPAVAGTTGDGWPRGMQGSVTFVAVWLDSLKDRIGVKEFLRAGKPFFVVKPVKVGPR